MFNTKRNGFELTNRSILNKTIPNTCFYKDRGNYTIANSFTNGNFSNKETRLVMEIPHYKNHFSFLKERLSTIQT